MKKELVKGFCDYTGNDAEKLAFIREIIRRTFESYNFEEAQTPIIEYEDFVKGDNSNDEAISDIFKLTDKGKRKLALRYEFTFQLKRLAENKKLPYKRFQIGPVFRDEPVQGNRLRQFTQCDIDVVGSSVKDEAEILSATKRIMDALKIEFIIYFNNRKLLNEILKNSNIKEKDFESVIREIDKLDKLPKKQVENNLKKIITSDSIKKLSFYLGKDVIWFMKNNFESAKEVLDLQSYCKNYGVNLIFSPILARGLSYYNGSIFEIKSTKIKETICAGGSYLVNGNQSCGISFGLDRLMLVTNIILDIEKYLVVSLNEDENAIKLANNLRAQDKNVSIYYGKPSKALAYANAYKIKNIIFVGAKEVKEKKFMVKDLVTGKQKTLIMKKVSKKNLVVRKK